MLVVRSLPIDHQIHQEYSPWILQLYWSVPVHFHRLHETPSKDQEDRRFSYHLVENIYFILICWIVIVRNCLISHSRWTRRFIFHCLRNCFNITILLLNTLDNQPSNIIGSLRPINIHFSPSSCTQKYFKDHYVLLPCLFEDEILGIHFIVGSIKRESESKKDCFTYKKSIAWLEYEYMKGYYSTTQYRREEEEIFLF